MDVSGNKVFVMHNDTWEAFKENEFEFANTQPDPIKYIRSIANMNVVIDNTLPFGIVELWDEEQYEKYMKEINGE